jgi:hypothetical protein
VITIDDAAWRLWIIRGRWSEAAPNAVDMPRFNHGDIVAR